MRNSFPTILSVTLISFGVILTACSSTESELTDLVSKRWLTSYKNKVTVESVKLLDMREMNLGQKIIEANFESLINVTSPILTNCFTISATALCLPVFGRDKPVVALGRYRIKTFHQFTKWKSGWIM